MTLIELVKILQTFAKDHQKKTFHLKEVASFAGVSQAATGMTLLRAARKGLLWRVKNVWINPMHPPSLEELGLALVSPSYVSFESALNHHHILSQSPRGGVTLATTGRSQSIPTPLGKISAIHLKESLFWGFDLERMALPEKAWLDLLYIRKKKGEKLSEVFYSDLLNHKRLKEFRKKIAFKKVVC